MPTDSEMSVDFESEFRLPRDDKFCLLEPYTYERMLSFFDLCVRTRDDRDMIDRLIRYAIETSPKCRNDLNELIVKVNQTSAVVGIRHDLLRALEDVDEVLKLIAHRIELFRRELVASLAKKIYDSVEDIRVFASKSTDPRNTGLFVVVRSGVMICRKTLNSAVDQLVCILRDRHISAGQFIDQLVYTMTGCCRVRENVYSEELVVIHCWRSCMFFW